MYTPEDHILEAVSAWDLPDDEAFINAVNDQARLMAGCFDLYEDRQITVDSH